jgi:hypothetical protein
VQLYTSASSSKDVGNIPGSHFVKAFSALPAHFNVHHHKSAISSMQISVEETGKNQQEPGQNSTGDYPVVTLFFVKKSLTKIGRRAAVSSLRRNNCCFSTFRGCSY